MVLNWFYSIGRCPLIIGANNSFIECLYYLVQIRRDVYEIDKTSCILLVPAVVNGKKERMEILAKAGADVSQRDITSETT